MDAFFAAVEQAAKPSLRGKPVIVGGLGQRGVVSTASYEARLFGVRSAMAMSQARRLCPNAAFLVPRFAAYRQVSEVVMGLLRELSPLVEPVSLDEAFVDLEAGGFGAEFAGRSAAEVVVGVRGVAAELRGRIRARTTLTGSVGAAASKFVAKVASELAKPDGVVVVEPGGERAVLDPLPVRALWGVGPATAEVLGRAGLVSVADLVDVGEAELVRLLGRAHGVSLFALAAGRDESAVVADRDAKSISVEDTFAVDFVDRTRVRVEVARLAVRVVERLRAAGRSGRTVVVKVRRSDFSTLTRSETLRAPTDDVAVVREVADRLVGLVDVSGGVRLLGVGVAGLADFTQEDLFAAFAGEDVGVGGPDAGGGPAVVAGGEVRGWLPGEDVRHLEFGAGWVQGSGVGRVTVRFEEPGSAPGRVRTFAVDDPALRPGEALPLVP